MALAQQITSAGQELQVNASQQRSNEGQGARSAGNTAHCLTADEFALNQLETEISQAVSPADQKLITRRDTLLNEVKAKLDASDHLSPVERIATIDRDKAYTKERTATLRQID